MKNLLHIAILLFSLPLISFAQSKSEKDKMILKEKEKKAKPVVIAGSKEYDILKAQKKLAHYEIRMDKNNKPVFITPNSQKTNTTNPTPCDYIPYVGPALSFSGVDDANTAVALPFNFCFYGTNYTSCNVSINGNIQFSTNSTAFSSTGFPSTTVNMIAPFWADCYLTSGSAVKIDVYPTRIVVSWDSMGYFSNHNDLTNSFQCVLTDGTDQILPPGKNVGFYYKKMQWTTGDASDGVNGFPDPTTPPAIPATVGINEGNGIDYYLIGRFGVPGASYDGPLGNDDGVSWLNGKKFYFNACPPVGSNLEPISTLIGYCDTLKVCGNDTLYIKNTFLAPEITQNVAITATCATLGSSFSFSTLPTSNSTDIYMIVDGSTAPAGYHTITMTATDNGSPAQTSIQNFVVFVNQSAVNNLNGTIVLTPTAGACPGGIVNANVIVNGGTPDSYFWSNNAITASTSFTTVVPADSLIFVTLTSGQCKKTILGDININPTPVASVLGNLAYCSGDASGTVLTATNTLNSASQAPYTYLWSTSNGTLSSTTTETTLVTGGTYSVTITNQFGCTSSTVVSVSMSESPNYTVTSSNAISGGSVYCVNQDTARIAINFATSAGQPCGLTNNPCVVSNTIQVGTATTNGSTSSYTPFNGIWESAKHQYLIRASELTAAGVVPGKLTSIAFKITNLNGNNSTFDNFSIKLKCVAYNTVGSSMDNTGLIQVYGPTTANVIVGTNTYNFTQPYLWDGTSNLLVDVCWFNQNWDGNLSVEYTNVGYNATLNKDADGADQCPLGTVDATAIERPNMIFGNCLAQQSGSQFNVVVTPTTGVVVPAAHDSIKIDLPSTSGITCYTVSLVNPIGGCFKDTVICVNASQGVTQGTLSPSSISTCPGGTVTLNALGALNTYTISYTDALGALQTSINSSVTVTTPSVNGTYIYTLSAIGPCGGALTDFTTSVNVISGVTNETLTASSNSVCPGTPITLSAIGNLVTYTISYTDNTGNLQTSVNNSVTVVPSNTTTPVFGPQTYTLSGIGDCGGPLKDTTLVVTVVQGVTQGTLSVSNTTVCPGTPITLSAIGALDSYTIAYNTGSGVQTSVNNSVTIIPTSTASPVFGVHTYTLLATGPCSGPLTAFIDSVTVVQGVTNATLTSSAAGVCIGSPITLTPSGSVQTYTIMYNNGSGVTSSINNGPVTFNTAVSGLNTYSLVAQGFCNAPITTTAISVDVTALANLNVTTSPNVTKCLSGSVTLSANVSSSTPGNPGSPYTYAWTTLPGNIPATGTNSLSTYTTNVTNTTTFVATVSGSCATTASASVIVSNFLNDLQVSIIDSAAICPSTPFGLTALASGGRPNYNFSWAILPNTSSVSNSNPATISAPEAQGVYTISVVVTDSCGYIAGDAQLITVLPPCQIVIPNIITPNGDGANDVFKITNIEFHPNAVLTVYDRWGKKVYENQNYKNDWNGSGINDGTYFYILDVPDDKKYNGFITIFTGK